MIAKAQHRNHWRCGDEAEASITHVIPIQRTLYMLSRRKFFQVALAGATSSLMPSNWSMGSTEEPLESRAIFDESLSWITEVAAHNVCQRIKRAGFNVLMPNVWHGRGTAWPSSLAQWIVIGLKAWPEKTRDLTRWEN
jgi:uncharacterized lipoprotein YddW (UPF0748 family)